MKEDQYFIEGKIVTCTVFNEAGVHFMASAEVGAGGVLQAMEEALATATSTKTEYEAM